MHLFPVQQAMLQLPHQRSPIKSKYAQALFEFSAIARSPAHSNGLVFPPKAILLPNVHFTVFGNYFARQLAALGVNIQPAPILHKFNGVTLSDPNASAATTSLRLLSSNQKWTGDITLQAHFSDVVVQKLKAMLSEAKDPAKGFIALQALRGAYLVTAGARQIEMVSRNGQNAD